MLQTYLINFDVCFLLSAEGFESRDPSSRFFQVKLSQLELRLHAGGHTKIIRRIRMLHD